jgi:tetratricopeptide (TPR) repeat protein
VVGKVFWSGVIAAMGNVEESSVRAGLQELGRKELVRSARESSVKDQAEYAFWHALVRDVAYSQIPRRDRIAKHVAAAEWIEGMAGDRVSDHAELLAHHYESALNLARAAGSDADVQRLVEPAACMFELAGDRAMSLDLGKARAYYTRAADLFPDGDLRRGDVLLKAVNGRAGSPADGERQATEALAIFRSAGEEVREGAALVALASIVWVRGDTARGNDLEVEALEKLERHPPGPELLNAYARRAGSLSIAGRSREALEVIERGLHLAEQFKSSSSSLSARMYQYRGIARSDLGDPEGVDDVRRGLELALEIGDIQSAGIAYSNLASNIYPSSARDALAVWTEGIEFTLRRGMTTGHFWQLAESTWALFDLGRWDEVVARATEVAKWAEQGGVRYAAAIAASQHALVLLYRGQATEAAPLVERFVPVARDAGDPQVLVPALAAAAKLSAASGDLPGALELAREIETRTRTGGTLYRPTYLPDLVSIALAAGAPDVAAAFLETEYRSTGRPAHSAAAARALMAEQSGALDEARALYEQAQTGWADYGFVVGRAEALLGAARCLVALGRFDEASAPARSARELFQELGAGPGVEAADNVVARATSKSA